MYLRTFYMALNCYHFFHFETFKLIFCVHNLREDRRSK
jgi:hypothetical protein